MKIEIINPLDFTGWDELLLTHQNTNFFHSSHWARVLCSSYGYIPLYFTVRDNGNLLALVPMMEIDSFLTGKRGISLPFTDFCEPILLKNVREKEVWNSLVEYGESASWEYLEIRGGDGFGQAKQPSSWYYDHLLDLSQGEQKLYSQFRNSTKRNIKKAERDGVEVSICDSLESMKEFYHLNCLTRRKHGLPPQPFSFFEKLYQHVISKNHGILLLARYHGKTIAAALSFHFGEKEKATFKFGASDARYQHLRANNLAIWKMIEFYCHKGLSSFSFGRTNPTHLGLKQFKDGWKAEQKTINYYRYNFYKKSFVNIPSPVDGWYTSIFAKTPIPVLRMIGSTLYKHIG